jgi:hypothetical protein
MIDPSIVSNDTFSASVELVVQVACTVLMSVPSFSTLASSTLKLMPDGGVSLSIAFVRSLRPVVIAIVTFDGAPSSTTEPSDYQYQWRKGFTYSIPADATSHQELSDPLEFSLSQAVAWLSGLYCPRKHEAIAASVDQS